MATKCLFSPDRDTYRRAFDFHSEALRTISTMPQDAFWIWFHKRMQEIEDHSGNELLQDFLVAICLDVERADKIARTRPT